MSITYKILENYEITTTEVVKNPFALDILNGLSENPKTIPTRYIYNAEGSKLFNSICELPEYYLTRCGLEIIEKYKSQIIELLSGETFSLIELGAGDGRKTSVLLDYFLMRGLNFQYVPIDISESAMHGLTSSIRNRFPKLNVNGLVAEYFNGIKWLEQREQRRNLVLFLGSNIGNFSKIDEMKFLRNLWHSLSHNDLLLIAFDLKKDIKLLNDAYNDSQGVTKEFNMNLLKRINNELGGEFNLSKFEFAANYNPLSGAVESFLISTEEQAVYVRDIDTTFYFKAWEPIHTEYSFKYTESDIRELASKTGYKIEKQFYDSKNYFTQSVWRVIKN